MREKLCIYPLLFKVNNSLSLFLCFCFCTSGNFLSPHLVQLYFRASDPLSELWQVAWIIPAFWTILAFLLLVVICVLWAPSSNPTRYLPSLWLFLYVIIPLSPPPTCHLLLSTKMVKACLDYSCYNWKAFLTLFIWKQIFDKSRWTNASSFPNYMSLLGMMF